MQDSELRDEQIRIYKAALLALIVSVAVFCSVHMLVSYSFSSASDLNKTRNLITVGSALLILLWLLVGIGMVSRGRRLSKKDIRGSAFGPPSDKITVPMAFLQNTLEQVVALLVTLGCFWIVWPQFVMTFACAAAALFSIGRICFYAGYPKGAGARAFGMALTALPTIFGFILAVVGLFLNWPG